MTADLQRYRYSRFRPVHARRERFSIRLLCRVLITDRCNYHGWVRAEVKRCERAYDDQQLTELIVEVHTAHPAYGAPRVTRELQRQGITVGQRRVARLMREHGIAGVTRRRRRNLTKPDPGAAAVPDLLRREFTAPMPGLKLVGDITCFATGEGWPYLATTVDLCSKELIGYAIAPHMRASLAVEAITAAHRTGLVAGNAIMHTDRGSQYHATVTGTRSSAWRSGRAPAGPVHVSTALRPSLSSPPSKPKSARTPGSTGRPRAGTLRTGSRPTTSGACIPRSVTRLRPKHEPPGRSACQWQRKARVCEMALQLQYGFTDSFDTVLADAGIEACSTPETRPPARTCDDGGSCRFV